MDTSQTAQLFGLSFTTQTKSQLVTFLERRLQQSEKYLSIATPNPEQIVQASQDRAFARALKAADVRIPDGVGILLANKIARAKGVSNPTLPERVSGRSLARALLLSEKIDGPFLLIGGRGYAQLAGRAVVISSELVESGMYKLKICMSKDGREQTLYWLPGYEQIASATQSDHDRVLVAVRRLKPQVVFVGLGAPWQELWLEKYRSNLEAAGVRIGMAVGGSFDVLLGRLSQPPQLVQKLGFEWLYRLISEPWRWRRQLRLARFAYLALA